MQYESVQRNDPTVQRHSMMPDTTLWLQVLPPQSGAPAHSGDTVREENLLFNIFYSLNVKECFILQKQFVLKSKIVFFYPTNV